MPIGKKQIQSLLFHIIAVMYNNRITSIKRIIKRILSICITYLSAEPGWMLPTGSIVPSLRTHAAVVVWFERITGAKR
jgi:hypothetical protein